MNVTQLRSLIAVADAGSFTAAAESVGVTQSGISQALAGLEENLGAKLLVRRRQGVELTAFGERVLIHARSALSCMEEIRREAAETAGREKGKLRIAAFSSVFATVLPSLLRRFRTLHPDVELIALETDDLEVEAWLEAGTVDLGVVLNPAPGRESVLIGADPWVAVVPTGHRYGRRSTLSLAGLVGEPFVLATGGCHVHARTLAEAEGLLLADVRLEIRDWVSAIALVREGEGVSLVPQSSLPENRSGLKTVPLDPPLARHFGLVSSPVAKRSWPAQFFLEAARQSELGRPLSGEALIGL